MRMISTWLVLFFAFINSASAIECDDKVDVSFIEQIVTNERGVCLLIGDSWLITDAMQASGEGMFVLVHGNWLPLETAVVIGDYEVSWQCKKCRRYSMDGVKVCPYCGKPKNA